MMLKKTILFLLVLAALIFTSGCEDIVIKQDVPFPKDQVKKIMCEIDALHAQNPLRQGTVSNLKVFLYIGDEQQLIRFSIPKLMLDGIIAGNNVFAEGMIKKHLAKHDNVKLKLDDINLDCLKNIDKIGPGLLAEIKVEEENIHIIIWMD